MFNTILYSNCRSGLFYQWLGEPDLRYKMQGRLILVHLMCRDMATTVSKMLHPAAVDGSVGPTGLFHQMQLSWP